MSRPPWFADGLRFSCQRCGACCTGAPGYVWVEPEDVAAIADALGIEAAGFLDRYARQVGRRLSLREEADGGCVFFEAGRGCSIYQVRPRQCRTWPFWPGIVASPAAWEREAAGCPGIGIGEAVPAPEIERLARTRRTGPG